MVAIGPSATIFPSARAATRSQTTMEAFQVVGHHEDREAERALQRPDQGVELRRRDRIEARGRLVEKDDLGIEGQGAGQRHALGHAAGKLRGKLVAIGAR